MTTTITASPVVVEITANCSLNYFYVATDGDDDNPGTLAEPWRTLSHAALNVSPGDTVFIRGGTYIEMSSWRIDGTEDDPITIRGYPGETAIINGDDRTYPPGDTDILLKIYGDYYVVQDLEISYSSGEGIIFFEVDHGIADNLYVHHCTRSGMHASYSQYVTIQNCQSDYNSQIYFDSGGLLWSSGIAINRMPSSHCTIRGCTLSTNYGQGIDAYETEYATVEDNVLLDSTIYISDAWHCLVQRNLVSVVNNIYGDPDKAVSAIAISDEKASPPSSDNVFINNILHGGINRYVARIGSDILEGCLFANNTLYNVGSTGLATIGINGGTYTDARIINNVIIQEDSIDIGICAATGITFSNNIWSKTPPTNMRGTDYLVDDPELMKTDDVDNPLFYKLKSTSPARGAGLALDEVTDDYWETARSDPPDMGAHEYT